MLDMDSGLQCEVCDLWYHTKCQKVSDDMFEFLEKNAGTHWNCKSCSKSMAKVLQTLLRCKSDKTNWKVDRTMLRRMLHCSGKTWEEIGS